MPDATAIPDRRLVTRWRLAIEALSPIHIGSGRPRLTHDYDYLAGREAVWVIDTDRVWEDHFDAAIAGSGEIRLSRLIGRADPAPLARYRLANRTAGTPAEIIATIRDAHDRPYLPGSGLKGAFRTALAWGLAAAGRPVVPAELGPQPQSAARPWERRAFGPDPNQDLLRALRVTDAVPADGVAADLTEAAVYTLRGDALEPKGAGYRWAIEALPAGSRFSGEVSLDEWVFGPAGRSLRFAGRRADLADPAGVCRTFATALAGAEAAFYRSSRQPALAGFYQSLIDRLAAAGPDEGACQIGWGTGWRAKTILWQHEGDPIFAEVIRRYRLDRDRGAGVFPKTRRLVERGQTPELPLGWIWFRLVPDGAGGSRIGEAQARPKP